MQQQLLAPIAVFQVFCSMLWMLDMYWQYTVFTILSIVMLESTSAFQRMKTFQQLNGMSSKPYPIMVYRHSQWQELSTEDLIPGDLISLKMAKWAPSATAVTPVAPAGNNAPAAPKQLPPPLAMASDGVPCDCVLLRGTAVVNEATLTGESVPQMKDGLKCDSKADEARLLDIDGRDRLHVLFSGTTLVNVGPAADGGPKLQLKPPDGGAAQFLWHLGPAPCAVPWDCYKSGETYNTDTAVNPRWRRRCAVLRVADGFQLLAGRTRAAVRVLATERLCRFQGDRRCPLSPPDFRSGRSMARI
jgi:cation-transporting ATPase 13A1